jgi:ABC-2 type transport system permease protein
MRNVWTIMMRSLRGYFSSPVAYVVIVIFLLLSSFFTFAESLGDFFRNGQANLLPFFGWHPFLYLFLVPAVGMGLWSEERRSGTIELLFTLPVSPWQAIVGKFLAAWVVLAIALGLTFPLVITVNYLGHPDNGIIIASYLGSLLMAGTYLAVTAMTSAMTRNQVVAFIVSVVICLFLVLAGFPAVTQLLTGWAPNWLLDGVAACSVWTHFESIKKGLLDSRDILYFLSLIGFSLFTTGVILRAHRAG